MSKILHFRCNHDCTLCMSEFQSLLHLSVTGPRDLGCREKVDPAKPETSCGHLLTIVMQSSLKCTRVKTTAREECLKFS